MKINKAQKKYDKCLIKVARAEKNLAAKKISYSKACSEFHKARSRCHKSYEEADALEEFLNKSLASHLTFPLPIKEVEAE